MAAGALGGHHRDHRRGPMGGEDVVGEAGLETILPLVNPAKKLARRTTLAKKSDGQQAPMPFEGETTLALFKDRPIRKVFRDGEWFLSVVDVVEAITGSQSPRRYWSDLKRKLAVTEGFSQLYEDIVQLKEFQRPSQTSQPERPHDRYGTGLDYAR